MAEKTYPAAERIIEGTPHYIAISERHYDAPYSRHLAVGAAADTSGITVMHYDPATGDVEVSFEGTFRSRNGHVAIRTLPDAFEVTQGSFKARIVDCSSGECVAPRLR